MSVPKKS